MPEGSDGFVRAEFQHDNRDDISVQDLCFQTWGSYLNTSSGGSDGEQDANDWGRCPRRGHLRPKTYLHSDHHGCQRGVRSRGKEKLDQYRQRQHGNFSEQARIDSSLTDKQEKRKQRSRRTSCTHDELKKNSREADITVRYLKDVQNNTLGGETEFAKEKFVEDSKVAFAEIKKYSSDFITKPAVNKKKEIDIQDSLFDSGLDNKEMYKDEKTDDELEKYEKVKSQPYFNHDKEIQEATDFDVKLLKEDKDRRNELMSMKKCANIKTSQMIMIEKLKKEEVKMETEKGDVGNEKQTEKNEGIDVINVDQYSLYGKLMVNMEQGKSDDGKAALGYPKLDNRDVEQMEIRNKSENEETNPKAVLDPLAGNEEEKSDESEVKETLGFEVDSVGEDDKEPECTLNFYRDDFEVRNKDDPRELDTFTSVDETSCSFSNDCLRSSEWQNSVLSVTYHCPVDTKIHTYVGKSDPENYIVKYHDSNRVTEFLEKIMCDTEALREHNKRKIIDILYTKFGEEEQYIWSSDSKKQEDLKTDIKTEKNECKIEEDENEKESIDINPKEEGSDYDIESEQAEINPTDVVTDDNVEKEQSNTNPFGDGTDKIIDCEQVKINSVEHGTDDVDGLVEIGTDFAADDFIDDMNDAEQGEMEDDIEPKHFLDAFDKDDDIKELVTLFEDTKYGCENKEAVKAGHDQDANEDPNTSSPENVQVHGFDTNISKLRKGLKSEKVPRGYKNKNLFNFGHVLTEIKKKTVIIKIPEKESGLATKRNWTGRGYRMLAGRNFGRRCSANTGGGKGGDMNSDKNPSSNNNEQRNSGNRRSQRNKDDKGEDENENNNNSNRQNDGSRSTKEATVSEEPTKRILDIRRPEVDYKRYKKKAEIDVKRKHSKLEDFQWLDKISCVITDTGGPTIFLVACLTEEQWQCVLEQLDFPGELSPEALQCSICITVDGLLKHYAQCSSSYNSCQTCVKMFSLICSHVAKCIDSRSVGMCEIRICNTIKIIAENNIAMHLKTLWFQVRKKLARIIDNTEEDVVQEVPKPIESKTNRPTSKGLTSISGPLQSIPEGSTLALTSTSRSGSRVLRRKRSSLAYVDEQERSGSEAGAEEDQEEVDSKHGLATARQIVVYSRAEIPDEADAIPTSSEDGSVESTGSTSTEGSGHFGITSAGFRYKSLPMGPPGQGEPYYPSFKDKPTGKKGIGEVVYSSEHQLVIVSSIWEKFKTQYFIEAKLAKHYTEEGVILSNFKSKLKIKGLRYQNDFQWVKITHLGNGMTGKCHLAMDFETEFKFCVKEIHISHYEKEEIELWSELDNPYIVQVYGAIRHGEKIYILQEFIEGGCLTEAINIQRKLGRRLSQLTALRFFQQLLHVLKYLKSRNILHEDLKADNILLNKTSNSVSIKVADFGLARRCQGTVRSGTKPVGTQTQWSPEKAEARVGYGFAAEIWAAICVLVHMLSGQPPWLRRYENYKVLIMVIVEKSPPIEDIPKNIHESIKDLIMRGFTVCQGERPTAAQLLNHHAFKLLDDTAVLMSVNGNYSILESMHPPTNQIDFDPNADLREIYRNLKLESEGGAVGGISEKIDRRSIVSLHNEEVPYYSNEYRVYTATSGAESSKHEIGQSSLEQTTRCKDKKHNRQEASKVEAENSGEAYHRARLPSHADNNMDPSDHIAKFFEDISGSMSLPQPRLQPQLLEYDPTKLGFEHEMKENLSREASIEHLSSGTATENLIPNFMKIGLEMNSMDDNTEFKVNSFDSKSNDEIHDNNFLENIDVNEALDIVRHNYTVPTVVNTSVDQSPGSQNTSARSSSNQFSEERTQNEEGDPKTPDNTVQSKQDFNQKQPRPSSISVGDDHLASFNDDDLFRSGSPKDLDHSLAHHIILGGNSVNEQSGPVNNSVPQSVSHTPRTYILTNTTGTFGEGNMTTTQRQGITSNYPLKFPLSAPTNPTQLAVRGPRYMLTNASNAQHMNSPNQVPQLQNNNLYLPLSVNQHQGMMPLPTESHTYIQGQQFGQGQQNIGHYVQSTIGMNETYMRSEMQPEDLVGEGGMNRPFHIGPHDQSSMPNQTRNAFQTSPQYQSLITSSQVDRYRTSTPRNPGNIYYKQKKPVQVPKQLFPVSEAQQYVRKYTDPRINDPRQVYEQRTRVQPGRTSPYQRYPPQPKTPILNPSINPRPPPPQEGQRLDLRLDINKAQNPPDVQGYSYALTAPVFSPPKTPKKSPDLHRTLSEVPLTSKKPSPQTGITSASSSKDDKMSTSASKSQFEEQDEAFRELSRTAEEALSQHSDHGHMFLFGEYDDDVDDEIRHEVDDRFLDNPAESLAHMLDPEQDSGITVTFRSTKNGKEFKMKFMARHTNLSWEKLIKEDLDGFSRVSVATEFQLQRFCLKLVDDSVIDLESPLGNSNLTVLMAEATDSDPWWIEGGMIMK